MSRRRAALVTGAARRVGRDIALHLASEGWDVGIHYYDSASEAGDTAKAVRGIGVACKTYRADLNGAEAAAPLIEAFCGDFPGAALLVNSAAIFERDTAETFSAAACNAHMAVNAVAPVLLARAFHGAVKEKGSIVNILDQKVDNLTPDYFSYTLSKAALAAATEMLAMALAPKIRVNGIAPGLLLPSGGLDGKAFRKAHANTLLGAGASVAEVCAAVSFLASAPAVTGAVIVIDGGDHLVRCPPFHDLPKEGDK